MPSHIHHLRNWKLLKRALHTKLWPGTPEHFGQAGMSTSEYSLLSLQIKPGVVGVRWNRGSQGLGVRSTLTKYHSSFYTVHHIAGAPLLHALQLSTSPSLHALKDVLPFTIHNPDLPEEAELQHIDTAFHQLSQNPLYQFSSLQSTPVKVTFDGLKTPESKGLLDYAKLAEEEQSGEPDITELDDSDALYQYAALNDKTEQ